MFAPSKRGHTEDIGGKYVAKWHNNTQTQFISGRLNLIKTNISKNIISILMQYFTFDFSLYGS